MTNKFTIVDSSDREKDENLSLEAKKEDIRTAFIENWVERDEEKEEREEEYRQIAKWVHYSCDDPIGEVAWLINALFEKNADGSRFSATFKDVYGDVLELEEEHDRY